MALTSEFARRARALEDSLLTLARDGSSPVDPSSSTAALARGAALQDLQLQLLRRHGGLELVQLLLLLGDERSELVHLARHIVC